MVFSDFIGMEFTEPDTGSGASADATSETCAVIHIQDHHCNPTGNINGGVIISMADNLATGAANRAYQAKTGENAFMVGVDVHAVMLSNQVGGSIRGVARPVRVGRRVTVVRTEVRGDNDKLLAEVTTTHIPVQMQAG